MNQQYMHLPTISSPFPHRDDFEYQLPKLVESVRQGWVTSLQAAAVVSVLFCGAETQMIATIKAQNPQGDRESFRFLLLLAYSAFALNASATIASLIMMDRLGEIPLRAYKLHKEGKLRKDIRLDYLLEDHGAGAQWTWMKWHCIGSLVAGSWCMFIQLALFVGLFESRSVAITMSIVCAIGISPWIAYLRD